MLDRKFWDKEGPIVRDKYRKHIFAKARDVNSRSFKGYTLEYGKRKRANKFKRQSSKYANSKAPVLTGDLLRDFGSHYKVGNKGVEFGWSVFGARVDHLAKYGRLLTTKDQPLPKGIMKYLSHKADKYIDDKLGPDTTEVINIGKK